MKQVFNTQKRPLALISGIVLLPLALAQSFGEDPQYFFAVTYSFVAIMLMLTSGYIYSHRKMIIEDGRIELRNINKERKRVVPFGDIKRIWDNNENFVIDLESDVIEIEKKIFHKGDEVSEAFASIKN